MRWKRYRSLAEVGGQDEPGLPGEAEQRAFFLAAFFLASPAQRAWTQSRVIPAEPERGAVQV